MMSEEIATLDKELTDTLALIATTSEEGHESLTRNRRREIQRHLNELEAAVDEFYSIKGKLLTEKLRVEPPSEVRTRNQGLSKDLAPHEDILESLGQALERAQDEQMNKESEQRRRLLEEQRLI